MHKIEYYQNKFNNIPQLSDDWLEGRKYAFGGSEMAAILNEDPYHTCSEVLSKKVTKDNIQNDCTEWGKLFEPIAKIFIEKDKSTKIYDFGSIAHSYYPVCYSPDGLIIDGDDLILLEIKSPIYRGVANIPDQYIHQVQTGMNVIHVKSCLFAQFRFRRCPIYTDPLSPCYDRAYHKEFRKRCKDKKPIQFGYIYWPASNELVDLGNVDSIIKFKPKSKPDVIIGQRFNPSTGYVLMWKLFDINYEMIQPDLNYLKDKEQKLWNLYKNLRNLFTK